jgi:hypothetical protein
MNVPGGGSWPSSVTLPETVAGNAPLQPARNKVVTTTSPETVIAERTPIAGSLRCFQESKSGASAPHSKVIALL